MPKISIVMPVYNTGEILAATIKSILNQTYTDFELLLIDDGSKDISSDICDEYQKKDNRIRIYHKLNSGICDTRNYGITHAQGKYIAFCDHDDLYTPNFLACMVSIAEKYEADIVKCGFDIDDRQKNIKYSVRLCQEEIFLTNDTLHEELLYLAGKETFETIWNGIYRLDLLKTHGLRYDVSFKHGGEDFDFNLRVFSEISSMVLVPDVLYIHIIRLTLSTSSVFYDDILFNFINQVKFIDRLTQKYGLLEKNRYKYHLQEYVYVYARRFVAFVMYSIKMKKKYSDIRYAITVFVDKGSLSIGRLIKDLFSRSIFIKERRMVMVYLLFRCFGPKLFYFAMRSFYTLIPYNFYYRILGKRRFKS